MSQKPLCCWIVCCAYSDWIGCGAIPSRVTPNCNEYIRNSCTVTLTCMTHYSDHTRPSPKYRIMYSRLRVKIIHICAILMKFIREIIYNRTHSNSSHMESLLSVRHSVEHTWKAKKQMELIHQYLKNFLKLVLKVPCKNLYWWIQIVLKNNLVCLKNKFLHRNGW